MMPSFFMTGTGSQFTRIAVVLLTLTSQAVAEPVSMPQGDAPVSTPSQDDLNRAAQLFDQGVQQFSRQEYENSARSFMAADALLANTKALLNALAAARQAQHPVLTAQAAQRALQRGSLDQSAAKMAQAALTDALRYVATLHLQCEPEPCSLQLDGEVIAAGTHYASAGAHEVRASGPDGRAEERLTAAAGSEYRLLLPLGSPAPPGPMSDKASPRYDPPPRTDDSADDRRKPLSPFVFGLGCTGTLALVALTTWSGLEVLSARRLHDDDSTAYDPEDVKEKQRRTDFLVAGSVVLGAATAAAGIWLVDWGSSTRTAVHVLPEGGVTLGARRDF